MRLGDLAADHAAQVVPTLGQDVGAAEAAEFVLEPLHALARLQCPDRRLRLSELALDGGVSRLQSGEGLLGLCPLHRSLQVGFDRRSETLQAGNESQVGQIALLDVIRTPQGRCGLAHLEGVHRSAGGHEVPLRRGLGQDLGENGLEAIQHRALGLASDLLEHREVALRGVVRPAQVELEREPLREGVRRCPQLRDLAGLTVSEHDDGLGAHREPLAPVTHLFRGQGVLERQQNAGRRVEQFLEDRDLLVEERPLREVLEDLVLLELPEVEPTVQAGLVHALTEKLHEAVFDEVEASDDLVDHCGLGVTARPVNDHVLAPADGEREHASDLVREDEGLAEDRTDPLIESLDLHVCSFRV